MPMVVKVRFVSNTTNILILQNALDVICQPRRRKHCARVTTTTTGCLAVCQMLLLRDIKEEGFFTRTHAQADALTHARTHARTHATQAPDALHTAQGANARTVAKVSSVTLEPMRAFRLAKSAARTWKCTQLRVREQTLSRKGGPDFRVTFGNHGLL